MPSTRRSGVDNALPNVSRPLRSSNTAMSVKVPPMSAARRMLAPLSARDRLLRAMLLLHSVVLIEPLHDLVGQALGPGQREPGAGDEIVARDQWERQQKIAHVMPIAEPDHHAAC